MSAQAAEMPTPTPAVYRPQEHGDIVRQNAVDAFKGTAAGRAAGLMTDVERGPGGTMDLVMRTPSTDDNRPQITPASFGGASAGLWAGGHVAGALGVPGAGAAGSATALGLSQTEPPTFGEAAGIAARRAVFPGIGIAEMIKRDNEQGNPIQTQMRRWLGTTDEPGYDPRRPGRLGRIEAMGTPDVSPASFSSTMTAPGRFGDWQPWGGISAEDGANFGAAAAAQFREGLNGVNITGYSATSAGVAPRSAPRPTGGDTPTEA